MKRFTLCLAALAAVLFLPAGAFAQDVCAPAKAALLVSTGKTTLTVTWTAPGDDCNDGTATAYDLRWSSSPIDENNFQYATSVSTMGPQSAGSPECASMSGIASCTTFYFGLKTRDENSYWSPLSTASGTTKCSGSQQVTCP
jgi:hypothetical protein